jgi:hypothetical protein
MSSSDVDNGGTNQTMYVGEEGFLLPLHLVLRRPVHGGGRDDGGGLKGEGMEGGDVGRYAYREGIRKGVRSGGIREGVQGRNKERRGQRKQGVERGNKGRWRRRR